MRSLNRPNHIIAIDPPAPGLASLRPCAHTSSGFSQNGGAGLADPLNTSVVGKASVAVHLDFHWGQLKRQVEKPKISGAMQIQREHLWENRS